MIAAQTCILIAALLIGNSPAWGGDDVASGVHTISAAKAQTTIISDVSKAAAAADAPKLLELTWPSARKSSGDAGLVDYFKGEIIPYFASFDKLDTYEGLSSIVMDDAAKSPAIVHFGYLRDSAGKRKPFEMVIVNSEQGSYLANIIVGRCIKGHHPVCE